MIVYLGIGSNIDPEINLPRALNLLAESVTVVAVSTHYRTAPLAGRSEQSDYINGVWSIETDRSFEQLKELLREIESACGRVRTDDKYESRPIDLDVLSYGDYVDDDLFTRPFLAFPLLELAVEITLRNGSITLTEVCEKLTKPDFVDHVITTNLKSAITNAVTHTYA